jgi:transposase
MRYIGIDIGSAKHAVAIVDEKGEIRLKSRFFEENQTGYEELFEVLGAPDDAVVAMEATGHYWQNIYVELASRDFAVVLINPFRTRRYAEESSFGRRPTKSTRA